jgi:zinc/manganese transport system permease protein
MGAHYLTTGFGWNLIKDIQAQFQYAFMQHAYIAGAIVAIVAGVVGYFVVLRSLSFAGHALSHIGFAGATGAVALGVNPIYGLLVFTVGGAVGMGALGKRIYGRDVVIGIVLAWMLGMGCCSCRFIPDTQQKPMPCYLGRYWVSVRRMWWSRWSPER